MAAILAWFLLIILPHLVLTLAGRRSAIPPVFLTGVGWLAGLRVRVEGRPAPGRLLLVANHVSWLDILALAGAGRAAFVARSSLADQPILRWLCEQNDTVFITRDQRGTVAGQIAQVAQALASRPLVVFPEGTTGDGRNVLPFKSALLSAAEQETTAGAPVTIQPVALDYADAAAIAWLDPEPGDRNVLRLLARTAPIGLTIRFLGPLEGASRSDRKAMAGAAQAAIERALRL
jgi:1-acyl-sn-glycerol-3-phosphate acyltransferase